MPNAQAPQPVTHALGRIVAVTDHQVTVLFSDIQANAAHIRGAQVQFQLDVTSRDLLTVGRWVIGNWNRNPKRDPTTNALRVQGSFAGGVQLQTISRAIVQPAHRLWYNAAAQEIKTIAERRQQAQSQEFGAGRDPDALGLGQVHEVLSSLETAETGTALTEVPKSWLPVPVGLPVMGEEIGYPDGYMRIGYVAFTVDSPAEEIRISNAAPGRRVSTLRSRVPIQKDNWHTFPQVSITLTLHGAAAINTVLLPLIRLFRRAPFQPVANRLLEEANITALTLKELQWETIPGFPNAIKAELVCWAFNWETYLSGAGSFDEQLCYPLMKLWLEKPTEQVPVLAPVPAFWTGQFRMFHPAISWLKNADKFAATANQVLRQNQDSDNAQTALDWSWLGQPPEMAGFTRSLWDASKSGFSLASPGNPGGVAPGGGVTWSMGDEEVGRAPFAGSQASFVRLRNPLAAWRVAGSPDCLGILQGPFTLAVPDPHAGQLAQGTAIDRDDFRARLGDPRQDPDARTPEHGPTIDAVRGGSYVFIIAEGSNLLKTLAEQERPAAPIDPGDPVRDGATRFEPDSLVIDAIRCRVANTIAPLQVRGHTHPAQQYLGGDGVEYEITGTIAKNNDPLDGHGADLAQIRGFLDEVGNRGLQYRGRLDGSPFGGFVIVDNELVQFMGTRHCLPMSWETDTIPGFPNALKFRLVLTEFDLTQRRREIIQDMMSDLPPALPGGTDLQVSTLGDSLVKRQQRAIYLENRLRAVELYPDMGLPTHRELAEWVDAIQADRVWNWAENEPYPEFAWLAPREGGTGWQWTTDSSQVLPGRVMLLPNPFQNLTPPLARPVRFADPDFYCAASLNPGEQLVEGAIKVALGQEVLMSDPYGSIAVPKIGQHLHESHVRADPQRGVADGGKIARGEMPTPAPIGATLNLGDRYRAGERGPNSATPPPASATPGAKAPTTPFVQVPAGQPAYGSVALDDSGLTNDRIARYGPAAAFMAKKYGIPQDLFFGLIAQETGDSWKAGQTSNKQAQGLVQLIPPTRKAIARQLGLTDINPFDPVANLEVAARFFSQLRAKYKDDRIALAAYNAGEPNVDKYGGIPPFLETAGGIDPKDGKRKEGYVNGVMRRRQQYDHTPTAQESATEVNRPEIERIAQQWKQEFNRGRGFSVNDLRRYIIDPRSPNELSPLEQQLRGDYVGDPGRGTATGNGLLGVATDFAQFAKEELIGGGLGQAIRTTPQQLLRTVGLLKPDIREDVKSQFIRLDQLRPIVSTWIGDATPTSQRNADGQIENGLQGQWGDYFQVRGADIPILIKLAHDRGVLDKFHMVDIPHRLFGQYAASEQVDPLTRHPWTMTNAFHNKDGQDMFHDLRESLLLGRLLGAFPTFYFALIDGGRALRVQRLFDHVYGISAVTSIQVHRTRKSPIDTATIELSNMYGHFSAQTYENARSMQNDTRGVWTLGWFRLGAAELQGLQSGFGLTEDIKATWNEHVHSLMLKPGARVHLRMGYGADTSRLPTVFNGVISEVPVSEGTLQIVALSDGVELVNDVPPTNLQGSTPVTRLTGYLNAGVNPRELIMGYMSPTSALQNLSFHLGQEVGPFFYYNFKNDFGIEHFGDQLRSQLMDDDGELGVNVYNPESSTPYNLSSAWDNTLRIMQFWRWDKASRLIGVNVAQATPWAIFEVARRSVPDFILAVHPFELRSTLFYGKPWFPLYHRYKPGENHGLDPNQVTMGGETAVGAPRESLMEAKPFQQFHLLSSDYNLLDNQVRADATEMVTQVQAVGTYNGWIPGEGDLSNENSRRMDLDPFIFVEHQRMKSVGSGLYTTVEMKGDDHAAAITAALVALGFAAEASAGAVLTAGALTPAAIAALGAAGLATANAWGNIALQSRRVEDYVAASVLRDHVKDMYQGHFLLLGSPHIKPYDMIGVADHVSRMNGPAEVKEVIHTMSLDTGFVTEVSPDCLNYFIDYEGRDMAWWICGVAQHLITGIALATVTTRLAAQVRPALLLQGVRALRKWAAGRIVRAELAGTANVAELKLGVTQANAALAELEAEISNLEAAVKINANPEVLAALERITAEGSAMGKLVENAPFWVKNQVRTQQVLRSLPNTDQGKWAIGQATGLKKNVVDRLASHRNDLIEDLKTKTTERNAAQRTKEGLNLTPEEERALRRRMAPREPGRATLDQATEARLKELRRAGQLSRQDARTIADELRDDIAKNRPPAKPLSPELERQVKILTDLDQAEAELAAASRRGVWQGGFKATAGAGAIEIEAAGLAVWKPLLDKTLAAAMSKTCIFMSVIGIVTAASTSLGEWIHRWSIARQCLTIFPLRLEQAELTAGINGHRGSVVGDTLIGSSAFLESVHQWLGTHQTLAYGAHMLPFIGDLLEATRRPLTPAATPTILPPHEEHH